MLLVSLKCFLGDLWLILAWGDWFRAPNLGDTAELLKLTKGNCWMFGLETKASYIKRGHSPETTLQKEKWKCLSHVQLFATPWTIQSMEYFRPEKQQWVAFPFSKGSSQPRIKPRSPTSQADSLPAEPQGKPNTAAAKPKKWVCTWVQHT